jgi:hypothetical protein
MNKLADYVNQVEKNSIVVGDFNLPRIDWLDRVAAGGRSSQFLQAWEKVELEHMVRFPTQVRGTILDMLLTNVPEKIIEIKGVGRLGKSDHTMIQASIEISRSKAKTTEQVPNCGEADWGAMRAEQCKKDWGKMLDCVKDDK